MTIQSYNFPTFPFDGNILPPAPIPQPEPLEMSYAGSGNPDFFLDIPLDLSVFPETPEPQPKASTTTAITVAALARADAIRGILAGAIPIARRKFSESREWKKSVTITNVRVDNTKSIFSIQLPDAFLLAMHAHVLKRGTTAKRHNATQWLIKTKALRATTSKGFGTTTVLHLELPAVLAKHPYLLNLTEFELFKTDAKANKKLRLALQTFYDNILVQAPKKYFSKHTKAKSDLREHLPPLETYIEKAIPTTLAVWDAAMFASSSPPRLLATEREKRVRVSSPPSSPALELPPLFAFDDYLPVTDVSSSSDSPLPFLLEIASPFPREKKARHD